MPIIDYKEIPESKASKGGLGTQDKFELFARDFLELIGYTILIGPDRGADGGRDIIVREERAGVGGKTYIRWLVSCKHTAQSGESVKPQVEQNILDRVESNRCQGFIGFYSMLPSSGLSNIIKGLRSKLEVQIYDGERIEKYLLASSDGITLARRYFPKSMAALESENVKPSDIFLKAPKLVCDYTGADLLDPMPRGMIALGEKEGPDKKWTVEDVYWCIKGRADEVLENRFWERGLISGWEDIPDLIIPLVYLKWLMALMNRLRDGEISDVAFEKLKTFTMALFPYVTRNMTSEEREHLQMLFSIPSAFGGMG